MHKLPAKAAAVAPASVAPCLEAKVEVPVVPAETLTKTNPKAPAVAPAPTPTPAPVPTPVPAPAPPPAPAPTKAVVEVSSPPVATPESKVKDVQDDPVVEDDDEKDDNFGSEIRESVSAHEMEAFGAAVNPLMGRNSDHKKAAAADPVRTRLYQTTGDQLTHTTTRAHMPLCACRTRAKKLLRRRSREPLGELVACGCDTRIKRNLVNVHVFLCSMHVYRLRESANSPNDLTGQKTGTLSRKGTNMVSLATECRSP